MKYLINLNKIKCFFFGYCKDDDDDDDDDEETTELVTRREDSDGLCGRKNARLTRFANDCFDVGIIKDFIFGEVDFYIKK